jgi:hypothetical protein
LIAVPRFYIPRWSQKKSPFPEYKWVYHSRNLFHSCIAFVLGPDTPLCPGRGPWARACRKRSIAHLAQGR